MKRFPSTIALVVATGCSVSGHGASGSDVRNPKTTPVGEDPVEDTVDRGDRPQDVAGRPFSVVEATILDMQAAMANGRTTSRQIVTEYLVRIGLHETRLEAALAINPNSLEEAVVLDRERAAGRLRGPLHGIPIALKDNIQTTDLPTTAGTLALRGFVPPYEATITRRLREAGAIIIAKTSMIEMSAFMIGAVPGNYNAINRFGMNPYDPRPDPRPRTADGRPVMSLGGSSSGAGTAANLWAASVGSETYVSILNPSNQTMLVGIKPTVGRLSRHGIVPVMTEQDTPGPMARTVTDAAILLGIMEGNADDPEDPVADEWKCPRGGDYTRHLNRDGLRGARIGIPRAFFYDTVTPPGGPSPRGGLLPPQAAVMAEAIAVLRREGAIVIDPANLPSVISPDPANNWLLWTFCYRSTDVRGRDAACSIAMKYGMKRDFNRWLQSLGSAAPFQSLTALREWNLANERMGTLRYGQSRLDISDEIDLERDRPRYQEDRARDVRLSRTDGIDAALKLHQLDALLFPGWEASTIASRAGYPAVAVPFGMIPNSPAPALPDGFNALPMPYGVSFTASRCAEPRLIELAYAFEQATRRRLPPPRVP